MPQPIAFMHPKFKTEICNKYDSQNGCPYGEQCQFRHPEDPPIYKRFEALLPVNWSIFSVADFRRWPFRTVRKAVSAATATPVVAVALTAALM